MSAKGMWVGDDWFCTGCVLKCMDENRELKTRLTSVCELAECLWLNREQTTGSGGLNCYGVPFDDLDALHEAVDKLEEE